MAKWNEKRSSGRERAKRRQEELQRESQQPGTSRSENTSSEPKSWLSQKAGASRSERKKQKSRWTDVQDQVDAHSLKRFRHRVGLIGFATVLLALLIFFIVVAFNTPDNTQLMLVATAPGEARQLFTSLPNGAPSRELFDRVSQVNRPLKVLEDEESSLFAFDQLEGFTKKFGLRGGGPDTRVLLFYISGVGVVDEKGDPFLVDLRGSAFAKADWIPLQPLLQKLGQLTDSQGDPVETVVCLESQPLQSLVSPGLMVDRFPAAVRKACQADELRETRLHVLLSHAEGQRSWYAPELGNSVFAYFVARGLAGEADGCLDDSPDKATTLRELSTYVRTRVFDWVNRNRVVTQTPMLLSTGASPDELQVLFNPRQPRELQLIDDDVNGVANRMNEVQEIWERFANTLKKTGYAREQMASLRPYRVARLEMILTRLEALAVHHETVEFEKLKAVADTAITELADVSDFQWRRGPRQLASLGEAAARNLVPQLAPDVLDDPFPNRNAWEERLQKWIAAQAVSDPQQRAQQLEELRPNLVDGNYTKPEEIRWFVWQWLRSDEAGPSRAQWNDAIKLLDDYQAGLSRSLQLAEPEPEWSEIQFLRLLDRYVDWEAAEEATVGEAIGAALAAREASEALAFRGDRQARYWIAGRYDELEKQRRQAEDLLNVGDFATAQGELQTLPEAYRELQQKAASMARKLDLYEQSLRSVPYLAAWEFRREAWRLVAREQQATGPAGRSPVEDFPRVVGELKKLNELTDELGATLYRSLPQAKLTDIDRIDTSSLERLLEKYRSRYNQRAEDLVTSASGSNLALLVEIEHALQNPLASPSRRRLLRDQYLNLLQNSRDAAVAAENSPAPAAGREIVENEDSRSSWKAFQTQVDRYWGESSEANPFDDVAQSLRNQVQELLGSLPRREWSQSSADSVAKRLEELASDWIDDRLRERRMQRNQRFGFQHFLRRAIPYYVANDPRLDNSGAPRAVGEDLFFIREDLFELMLAARGLQDFWGDGAEREVQPYFARRAQLHLDATTTTIANDLQKEAVEQRKQQLTGLAKELESRRNRWLTVQDNVTYSMAENSRFNHQTTVDFEPGLPPGTAAYYLRRRDRGGQSKYPVEVGSDQRTVRIQPLVVDADPTTEVLRYLVPVQPPLSQRQRFEVSLVYRGHETTRDFVAALPPPDRRLAFEPIEFTPYSRARAQVTVSGGPEAISDVVVVVDCSLSMNQKVKVEGGEELERIRLAGRIARKLIEQLRDAGNYRVALMAYGRRVNYTQSGGVSWNDALPQAKREAWKKQGVQPYNDVEVLFGLPVLNRPMGDGDFANILDFIDDNQFRPWGQTPLYQSIRDAAAHLRNNGNPESVKHIVVITDGVNQTAGQGVELGAIAKLNAGQKVVELIPALRGIQVHMVLYGVDSDSAADERKKQYLIDISKLSGVQEDVIDSSDASVIEQQIGSFVVPNTYRITPEGQTPSDPPTSLGETWRENITRPGPQQLTVSIPEARPQTLFLYGGEKLAIDLSRGNEFTFRRIPDKNLIKAANDVSFAGDSYQFGLVDVEDPQNTQNFKVAMLLDDDQQRHTDRPGTVVLDVDCEGTPTRGLAFYRLVDYNFELETSYPILNFPRINTDPGQAYRLRLHAVPRGIEPDYKFQRPIVSLRGAADKETIKLEDGPTLEVYRKASEVHVEVRSDDAQLVRDLLVQAPGAAAVKRSYAKDWTEALYQFTFEDTALELSEEQAPQVLVYRMSELFSQDNDAITVEFPFP